MNLTLFASIKLNALSALQVNSRRSSFVLAKFLFNLCE